MPIVGNTSQNGADDDPLVGTVPRRLISKIIAEGNLETAIADGIETGQFDDDEPRRVFQWMLEYHQRYNETPTAKALKLEFPTYRLIKVPEPYQFYVDRFWSDYARTILVDTEIDVHEALEDADNKLAIDRMRTALAKVDALGQDGGYSSGQIVGIPATEKMRAARWLWDERIELRTLTLLAGRGGLGKSTIALDIAAKVSRGTLPGYYFGKPKGVVICATEDDWWSVCIPNLDAMGADRSKIFHTKVKSDEALNELTLPSDLKALEKFIIEKDAALIILDPLLSRLGKLDTHKDAEVRLALEPLVQIAVRTKSAVLGIMHVNKSGSKDAMQSIMASAAFANVARSTLMVFKHPEEPALKIFCPDKNNHAEDGKGTMTYHVEGVYLGQDTEDGDDLPIYGRKVVWGDPDERSADEIVEALSKSPAKDSAVTMAKIWLSGELSNGGQLKHDVVEAATMAGISEITLRRAKDQMEKDGDLETKRLSGKPTRVEWRLTTSDDQTMSK